MPVKYMYSIGVMHAPIIIFILLQIFSRADIEANPTLNPFESFGLSSIAGMVARLGARGTLAQFLYFMPSKKRQP